ncbi:MAG: LysR family transcriptional regulator [Rhodobacteraceae bacterium]|nr:LysR family transcriptional regulator [Paracoccaceae bacterium]
MNYSDLQVINALQRNPTFSAAARDLGVAHTTIARKVAALEAHFDARLIERVGDKVVLTAEGEKVVVTAQQMDEAFLQLERNITGRDGRLTGQISLTTVDILAWRYMDRLQAFSASYPDIKLNLSTDSEVRSLSRREAEVAIRLTNTPEEHLYGHVIGRLEFAPYVLASIHENLNDPNDMNAFSWIGYSSPDCAVRAQKAIKKLAPNGRISSTIPTPLLMQTAIKSGLGAGLLPTIIADGEPDLVRLGDEVCFALDIWILTPKELRHTARIRALFSILGKADA